MKDPIVAEVRKIRKTHSDKFNNNIESIFDNIIKDQKKYSDRLVHLRRYTGNKEAYMLSEKHSEYSSNGTLRNNTEN